MPYRRDIYEEMSGQLPTDIFENGTVIAAKGKEAVKVINREHGFWDPDINVPYSCYHLEDMETGKVFKVRDKCCEMHYAKVSV